MPGRALSCECCCDLPTISYLPSAVLSHPPYDGHRDLEFALVDQTLPSTVFTYESFSSGGTVESWSVTDATYSTNETNDPGVRQHPTATVALSVTGTQFTAGVHLWPNPTVSLNPATEHANEVLPSVGAGDGRALFRHSMDKDKWPGQYYDNASGLYEDPSTDYPMPFFGIVLEQSGTLFYGVVAPYQFDRCFRVQLGDINAAVALLPTGQFDTATTPDIHCYPDPAPADFTRIGFVAGLTTWLDRRANPSLPWVPNYVTRTVPSGTHHLSAQVSYPGIQTTFREYCQCFFRDELALLVTFPEGSGTHFAGATTKLNPPELWATSFQITRASGANKYSGSQALTINAANAVMRVAPTTGVANVTWDNVTPGCGTGLGTVSLTTGKTAAQLQTDMENDVASGSAPGDFSVSGGPWPTPFDITFQGQYASREMRWVGGGGVSVEILTPGNAGKSVTLTVEFDPSVDCESITLTWTGGDNDGEDCQKRVLTATVDDPFNNLDPINVRYTNTTADTGLFCDCDVGYSGNDPQGSRCDECPNLVARESGFTHPEYSWAIDLTLP